MEFTCGYCGKPYPTIGERMECERKCHEKKAQEEEKLKSSKREEDMKSDSDKIFALAKQRDDLDAKISELVKAYDRKYGVFTNESFYPFFKPFERFFRI